MTTLLLIIMLIAGIIMSIAILLMAPKGGLGFGLGGFAGSNEYGTKKSIEGSLKKVATITAIIFVLSALVYPYTKEKKVDESQVNSGAVAPVFDLGNGEAQGDAVVVSGIDTLN